jgi:hypothetical protein
MQKWFHQRRLSGGKMTVRKEKSDLQLRKYSYWDWGGGMQKWFHKHHLSGGKMTVRKSGKRICSYTCNPSGVQEGGCRCGSTYNT